MKLLFEKSVVELNKMKDVEADNLKTVRILFKRGGEVKFNCRDFKFTLCDNYLTDYEIVGAEMGTVPLYIDTREVLAILFENF